MLIGGGLIGLATAFALRQRYPEKSLLVVEQGGIPSEEGATQYSPAIHHHFFADESARARVDAWGVVLADPEAATGARIPIRNAFTPCGVLSRETAHLEIARSAPARFPLLSGSEVVARWPVVPLLLRCGSTDEFAFDPAGGCGNADAVALCFGQGAVRLGADLCLNARAAFNHEGELRLDRLVVNNRMQIEIAAQTRLRAARIVLAAGAATASLAEHQLGEVLPLARCFLQFPRIERDPALPLNAAGVLACPVLLDGGFAIRPHLDGALVIPPLLPPDPDGYEPVGGRFLGVPVGLRREHLLQFAARLDDLPALSRSTLNPGKTALNLRRMWEVLTPDGQPACLTLGETPHRAVVGGPAAFCLGPPRVEWPD